MIIGVNNRFVFIANSKTGSTSIEAALSPYAELELKGSPKAKHKCWREVREEYSFLFDSKGFEPESFFRFGVIREPAGWILSWYNYRRFNKHGGIPKDMRFDQFWDSNDWVKDKNQKSKFIDGDGICRFDLIFPLEELHDEPYFQSFRQLPFHLVKIYRNATCTTRAHYFLGHKRILTSFLFLLAFQCSWAESLPSCEVGNSADSPLVVNMQHATPPTNENSGFLGANILYWIDNDLAWSEGLGDKLKQLGALSLRFPGGEVADKYDWEKNLSEIDEQTPHALDLDYLEFLREAKAIDVKEIFFVVNLESAFLASGNLEENILRYAQKASRWVKAVKEHGYVVNYWEVGNESNHRGTTFSLTASEYAHALSVFSREMRKIDPNIKIAANGPVGVNASGFADKLTAEQLHYFRGAGKLVCGKKARSGCIDKIREAKPGIAKPRSWWNTLIEIAPNDFDIAVVHQYTVAKLPKKLKRKFRETERILQLRTRLTHNIGKPIGISVTEWNIPPRRRVVTDRNKSALNNAIKLGNYMAAGVGHAIFWPLRYTSAEGKERALLSLKTMTPTPLYRALEQIKPVLSGKYITQSALGNEIYMLQTRTPDAYQLMLVNQGESTTRISLEPPEDSNFIVQVNQLSGPNMIGGAVCESAISRMNTLVTSHPNSLTAITFRYP